MQCLWIRHVALTVVAVLLSAPLRAGAEPPAPSTPAGPKKQDATVGIGLSSTGLYPMVAYVVPDTPAGRSGKIHRNDLVIAIGQGTEAPVTSERMPLGDAAKLIRGPKGTVVTLKILPDGKQVADAISVSLTRGAFAELSRFGDGKFPAPGTKSPSLKARSLVPGGSDFELTESDDQIVVLMFWAEWLADSTEPIDLAQRLMDQNPEWSDRVEFIAVSVDDDKHQSWQRFRELTHRWDDITPVWTGPSVLKAFHVDKLPTVYVIDPQLRVITADHRIDLLSVLKNVLNRTPSKSSPRPEKASDVSPKSP
jgi:hypothetical protein